MNTVLFVEKVVKHPNRAEADRFFDYPYAAIEEILVNAVFHKSYRLRVPVEIRIYVDCIKVINHPGPEKTISMDDLIKGQAISSRNRNRRIGEFLKEIDLCEKKSTGITKILRALEANGSPPPEFKTDEERNYLIVTVKKHEGFCVSEIVNETVNEIVNETVSRQDQIIDALRNNNRLTIMQLAERTGITKATINREIKTMKLNGKIRRVGSDKSGYWEVL